MQIVVVNNSKKITDVQARAMTDACNLQVARHLAPAWSLAAVPVTFLPKGSIVPSGACPIAIIDAPDAPGVLGYHTEEANKVWGRVFVNPVLRNGGVVLYDSRSPQNISVASVLSHEVLELACDPSCNRWVDGPAIAQGSEYALEVGDPVESDSYVISVTSAGVATPVSVSNFVFPEWFDPQTPRGKRVDQMSRCAAPFTMTGGGYMIVRNGPGTEQEIFGSERPAWRSASKLHDTARGVRRKHPRS